MTPVMTKAIQRIDDIARIWGPNRFKLKPTTMRQYRTRRTKEISKELSELRRLRAFGEVAPKTADERIKLLTEALEQLEG